MTGDGRRLAWVSELAAEIDRLFVAGHRAARPLAMQVRAELGLESFGVLVDLRRPLLSSSGMTLREALALQRYTDPAEVERSLDRHLGEGHLTRRGDFYLATTMGRAILEGLTEALAGGLETLWAEARRPTAVAHRLTSRSVERGRDILSEDQFPAFHVDSRNRVDAASQGPALALWSDLASLRYLRADAHALAWSEAGLGTVDILCLSALCHRNEPVSVSTLRKTTSRHPRDLAAALAVLAGRGWVSPSGRRWAVTEEGRRARDGTIERSTNIYTAVAFEALSQTDCEELMASLRALPSEPILR